MSTLTVNSIKNMLLDRSAILTDNDGSTIEVVNGQTLEGVENFTLTILASLDEITQDSIRSFEADGESGSLGYVVVNEVGLISARGIDPSDFENLQDPSLTWVSLTTFTPGDSIKITIKEDNENITWIIGDVDTPV